MLKGKTALVTGSTSGIGLGLATAFAKEGANVVLNGFGDAKEIEAIRAALAKDHRVAVTYSAADMTKPDEIAAMIADAEKEFGAVDILCNNAGIQHVAPVEEFPIDKWNAIIAINLSSAFHTIRAALPKMKAKGWGRIVNTGSAHALVASPFKAAYVAAKHGIAGLTKTVALETAEAGITVNAICPGYVWTPLVEKTDPRHHEGAPHDGGPGEARRAARGAADQAIRHGRRSGGAGALPLLRRGEEHHRRAPLHRRRLDSGVTTATGGRKRINLALQGGGAHGAFTWGVLDALLKDERLEFEAISGASAGAMNAVVLADGLRHGGREGARRRLAAFWRRVSREGGGVGAAAELVQSMLRFWPVNSYSPFDLMEQFASLFSPYRTNPLNINPLRDLVARLVRFDRVHESGVKLFLSATNVRTGKIKVFTGEEIDADAVMASACLPLLFQAVEIGEEAYWDGGFMGNPALFPFFTETTSEDILLVQVNPIRREEVPHTASEITERMSEITFNASLLREFRAIDFVNRLMDESRLDTAKYRRHRLHRIDATAALAGTDAASKLDTSWLFFTKLHAAGRAAATAWLTDNYDAIGNRATLDLRAEFT